MGSNKLLLLSIVGVFVIGSVGSLFLPPTGKAESSTIKMFPQHLRDKVLITSSTCGWWDTDGNGHVRCTVGYMPKGTDDLSKLQSVYWECGWGFQFDRSCKPLKASGSS